MISPRFRLFVWVCLVCILPGLIVLSTGAHAAAAPFAPPQQATDYVGPDDGYFPPEGDFGTPLVTEDITSSPPVDLTPSMTVTFTATLPPDRRLTEQAEMGNSQVTPAITDTPGPSITPYISPTPTSLTSTPEGAGVPKKGGGLKMDWGMFAIGFSIPVIAACGLVLYLIDRRPDLFKPSASKQLSSQHDNKQG